MAGLFEVSRFERELRAKYRKLADNSEAMLDDVGRAVAKSAQRRAARDTGELQEGITFDSGRDSNGIYTIISAPGHGWYVEYGRGNPSNRTKNPQTGHVPPQPFMRPARKGAKAMIARRARNLLR